MIRALLLLLFWLYLGVLLGQVPSNGGTLGRTALETTQRALFWTQDNWDSLVSHAGFKSRRPEPVAAEPKAEPEAVTAPTDDPDATDVIDRTEILSILE